MPTTYSLGNLVWLDANNNGLVDEDESGVADVPVRLLQNGAEVATKRTNSAGHYVFTGLAAGDYVVEVSGPLGLVTSTGINGGLSGPFEPASDPDNDRNDDDNGSLRGTVVAAAAVTIGGTEPSDDGQLSGLGDTTPNARSNYSVDFGFFTPASLGDKVYYDTNKDGIQDDSETGVANVTVRLLDAAGNEIARTQTNSDGRYVFENLIPGSYVVEFVPSTIPPCTQFTKQDVGDDAKDSDAGTNGRTGATTLKAGDAVRTVDAGVMCVRASLGDTVWFDTNGNGQQDTNEAGVPAVTVRLYNADGAQVGEQITDSSGRYRFGDLAPSRYMVEFVVGSLPTGFALTSVDAGADVTDSDADPKTGKTISYSLAPSENNPTIDAGIVSLKAALGDTVWFDEDGNGVQDSNEKGVPNVKVDVVDASGAVVGSTITDAAGKYIFTNLNAGAYVVVFDSTTLPSGYEWTASNVGADGTDSDVDPANGRTATSTLKAGDVDLTLDGGIRRKAGTPNTSIPTTSTSIPTNTVPVSTNPSASTPGSPTSVPVVTTPGPSTTVASEVVTKPAPDAPKGSIGDCVWLDRNGNGIQDADEQPVVKAKVRLTLPDGSTTETSTDATGCYTFRDLPAGRYQVEVKGNAKPTNGPKVRVVDLAPGENHVEADFGFNQASVQGVQFQRDNFLSLTGANSLMLLAVALMMGGAGTFFVSVRRKQTP